MTSSVPPAGESPATPEKKQSRAGRNLPAAIGSAVVLLTAIALTLLTFDSFPFVFLVTAAILVGVWELRNAFAVQGIRLPYEPMLLGTVLMLFGAWFGGVSAAGHRARGHRAGGDAVAAA